MLVSFLGGALVGELDPSIKNVKDAKIIALHGWGRTRKDLLKSLKGLPVVAIDLPGHGTSPLPINVDGARDNANQLQKALEEKELKDLIVVGHSYGGRVAICLAAEHPKMVKALVGTGVPLVRRNQKPSAKYRLIKFLNKIKLISDKKMNEIRNKKGSSQYRQTSGIARDIFVKLVNESYIDELKKIECPIRFVWGENDTEASIAQVKEAMTYITSDCKLDVVENKGHDLNAETDQKLKESINEFLD